MKTTTMCACLLVLGSSLLADSLTVKHPVTDTAQVAQKVEQLKEQQIAMTGQLQSIKRLLIERASARSKAMADSTTTADTTFIASADSVGHEATDDGME